MKSTTALAKAAWISILGTVGKGTSFEAALANHTEAVNLAPVPPANPVQFAAPPFTTFLGHVRVLCYFTINANGGTLAVGDTLQMVAMRDGAAIAPGVALGVVTHANELVLAGKQLCLGYEDTVVAGSTHAWGAEISISGGHTAGASLAGLLIVIIQDLSG
jgi:hypothetical protein